jgi:hypothetical protein
MNNGVTVESGDKFKELIEKIKGLTEGEGNKGIQYAEGTKSVNRSGTFDVEIPITTNLDFTPTYIFAIIPSGTIFDGYSSFTNICVNNLETVQTYSKISDYGHGPWGFDSLINDISSSGFNVNIHFVNGTGLGSGVKLQVSGTVKWYAIGVGEEDTTLRDSLASILQEEGVNVTEEDDMASLITKVDEEFTEKNNELSGINNSYTLLKNTLTSRDISVPNGATFDDMVALVNEKLSWTRVSAGSGSTYYTKQVGDIYLGSNGQVRDLGTITLSSTSVPKDKYISSLQISFPIYVYTDMPSVLICVDAKVISSDGTVKYTGSASKFATDSGTTNTLSVIVRNIDANTDKIQITAHGSTSDIYGRTVKAGTLSLQGTLITN